MPRTARTFPRHLAIRAAARSDSVGFVNASPAKTLLDEVQRVPEVFTSLKGGRRPAQDRRAVHSHRLGQRPLRSPARRLARRPDGDPAAPPAREVRDRGGRPRFLGALFRGTFKSWIAERLGRDLAQRVFLLERLPSRHS